MDDTKENNRLFILPVRRKLGFVTLAYLVGILLAGSVRIPAICIGVFCALSVMAAVLRFMRRKGVLLCLAVLFFGSGYLYAACELWKYDLPTQPGVEITGVVSAIEKDFRVYLSGVRIDGGSALARDVLVTLMLEEEDTRAKTPVYVGQRISGTGRLFSQDVKRNPGGIHKRIQALCDGYELSGYILPGWTAEGEPVFSLREEFRKIREKISIRIDALFSEHAALFRGMMLGDRSGMDRELVSALRLTGTAHILTISGLHLSMIAVVLSKLLDKSPMRKGVCTCVLGVFLLAFTGLTGAAPGTVRACIMALIRELASIRGKKHDPMTTLAAAALLMTLVNPLLAMNASFQFSFFVVLGIHLLDSGRRKRKDIQVAGVLKYLLDMTAFSACAQLAAMPMQLMLYGYVPVLSLPMNIVCGLFMQIALLGSWASLVLSVVFPIVGYTAARLLCMCASAFEQLSVAAAGFKNAIIRLPAPYGISILLFAAAMALSSRRIYFGKKRKKTLLIVLALLGTVYLLRFCPAARYVQLDVGQGDAAVIRRGRHAVLVDVGPADSYDMLRYLRHEGLYVDAVLLSHLDEDHAGALGVLLGSEIEIPAVVMPEGALDKEVSEEVERALDQALSDGIDIHTVTRGDTIDILGMRIEVLSPTDNLHGSNERSLVLYGELENVSMLLTGDLPADCEPVILPACDILKVAHHGSKYATSDVFVNMTRPELALISVGANNPYGHPGDRVIKALQKAGSRIARTDEGGCITVWLCNGRMYLHQFLKCISE